MLVSEVIDSCLTLFAEETSSPNYLPRTTLLEFINRGNRVLLDELDCFEKTSIIQLLENVAAYELPEEMRTLKWVYYNDELLDASSVRRLTEMDTKFRVRTGKPEYYYIDGQQRNFIRVYKIPESDGTSVIFTQDAGVVTAITDAYSLEFDSQTGLFSVGSTVTGGTSGATGVIIYVSQPNDYSGKLYFSSVTGTFQDNEALSDGGTGAATANGTLSSPASQDTYTFKPNTNGVVVAIDGTGNVYDFVDSDDNPSTVGVVSGFEQVTGDTDNLVIVYSYYIDDLLETDSLPPPYQNGAEMYINWVMSQMYIVEATEQDWEKVKYYLTAFARKSGIEFTKLWTSQREYRQQPYEVETNTPRRPRLPDDYGRTEY